MSVTQIYRSFLGFCGLIGVSLQIAKDGAGMLLYYTVLSNILVFTCFFYSIYYEYKYGSLNDNRKLLRLKGGVTLAITLTFLVYHFLLAPKTNADDFWNIRNFLVHYIAPLGMILDTIVFDRRGSYRRYDPLLWTILPLTYCLWALANGFLIKWSIPGASSSPFPYFFLDVYQYGWMTVAAYIISISLFYILIGYLLFALKHFVGFKQNSVTAKAP
ncbi:Pr6Pr family membrane protein [Streptococcus dentasini]